jgi:hypothetical protein
MAASPPFVWKNTLKLSWRPFDKKHLDRLRGFNGFANMGIALADLGVGIGNAFGWNHDRVGYAASLTKIAAMYAAFQLQASLQKIPDVGSLSTAALQKRLQEEWRPELKGILGTLAKNDFPNLATIFVPNKTDFSFNAEFQKALADMIGPSKNEAAARCIRSVGFDYLAAALIHGGFYSPADGKGLWLSGDFVGGYQPGVDGKPAPGVTTIAEPSQRHQVATAEAVTLFVANLGRGQLISEEASRAMQALMYNSYAARQLRGANRVVGKLGIQPNNVSFHDCAIVERHCMRYAMTVLFMPNSGTPGKPLIEAGLFSELDSIADELFASSHNACQAIHTAIKTII